MSKELDHITKQLETIERKLQSLEDQGRTLEKRKEKLTLRGVELRHGVKVGTVVHDRGVEYRVSRVDTDWGIDKPWLYGNPKKKDGTWSARSRCLYENWEKVS